MGRISDQAKKAIVIGTLCAVSYFFVYIGRNVLGAVTPQLIHDGFAEEYIGSASSLFFVMYAVGQLINGMIGDKIKGKWMISVGLLGAGLMTILFFGSLKTGGLALALYGLMGYFLSMIYGPMTKLAAENTEPVYATRCAVGYDFASCVGAPAAGLLASLLIWKDAFSVAGICLLVMAAVSLIGFTVLERRKVIRYGRFKPEKNSAGNIKLLLRHKIVKYSLVSVLTGVVRTSVVFWLPTYFNQYAGFPPQISAAIFTGVTLIMSTTTFLAVVIYEKLHHDMDRAVLVMFLSAAGFFLLTYLVKQPVLNIVCIVLAIMSSNGAASILWSRYCPSLRDTGMVSSVTGYLDFLSYLAAAAANLLFANAASAVGWGNLILIWLGLMILGVVISLPYEKMKIHS